MLAQSSHLLATTSDDDDHTFERLPHTHTYPPGQSYLRTTAADDDDDYKAEMPLSDSARPLAIARPSDGHSAEPLLEERGRGGSYEGYDVERARRRHEMRSRSPAAAKELATRKKYLLAAVFLVLSLVSFVVQTEATAYIQSHLGWRKPYLML